MLKFSRPSVILLSIALSAISCSGKPTQPGEGPAQSEESLEKHHPGVLHRDQAAIRAKQIQKVSYELGFELDERSDTFRGDSVVRFGFRDKGLKRNQPLWVDLAASKILKASINGKEISDLSRKSRYDGERLFLRSSELNQGPNELSVSYEGNYGRGGHGLIRYTDRVDGRTYLYTTLEPYHAHQVFPCFDQPDLKGTVALKVDAPATWTVISTQRETSVEAIEGVKTRRRWTFRATPPLSPYVFALHAGPFSSWKSSAEQIPLRLFSRRSTAAEVDSSEWFDITRRGLEFYSSHFGAEYPLPKYDQVIVPDLGEDGVESAGAALFSEDFIFRSHATADMRRERAEAILRELAHAWFGNLVSIRWWNGLWLKESFATFMAAWALEQSTPMKGAWHSFFAGAKTSAYTEDQLSTAHIVDVSVPDTEAAYTYFDSITYGKGAAMIRQLARTIGEDDFKEGLQRYFDKYAGRSATLADLMHTLGEAAGEDLLEWQRFWFQTTGPNTLETEFTCAPHEREVALAEKAGVPVNPEAPLFIDRLILKQTGPGSREQLRPHRTQVALYTGAKLGEVLDVAYSGAETEVKEAKGEPCPDFVFANHADYDYVKLVFDPKSLAAIRRNLSRLEDPLTRHMIWRSLWSMVEDQRLPARDFAELVLAEAPREKTTLILADMLSMLISDDVHDATALKFLSDAERPAFSDRIEAALKNGTLRAPKGSDLRATWLSAYFASVHTPAGLNFLRSLLVDPDRPSRGKRVRRSTVLTLDQDQRWDAVQALARNGAEDATELVADELARDETDFGRLRAISAEAAVPEESSKRKWMDRVAAAKTDRFTSGQLRAAMRTLLTGGDELIRKLSGTYFEVLPKLAERADEDYVDGFTRDLFPSACSQDTIRDATELLARNPGLPPALTRRIKDLREDEERCIRVRGQDGSAVSPAITSTR